MFPASVLLEIERLPPLLKMPPPSAVAMSKEPTAWLLSTAQLASVIAPLMFSSPPPRTAELPLIVQLVSLVVAYSAPKPASLITPPPKMRHRVRPVSRWRSPPRQVKT